MSEEKCSGADDGKHCSHWDDGGHCCLCNAPNEEDAKTIATLEAENAKLRDLLRRVYACAANGSSAVDTTVRLALLLPEISKAIEPSGDAGEVKS